MNAGHTVPLKDWGFWKMKKCVCGSWSEQGERVHKLCSNGRACLSTWQRARLDKTGNGRAVGRPIRTQWWPSGWESGDAPPPLEHRVTSPALEDSSQRNQNHKLSYFGFYYSTKSHNCAMWTSFVYDVAHILICTALSKYKWIGFDIRRHKQRWAFCQYWRKLYQYVTDGRTFVDN